MNPRPIEFAQSALEVSASTRWRDPDTGHTLVLARPIDEPEIWAEYLSGAQRSYLRFGATAALDLDSIRDGSDTMLFLAVLDGHGEVIGGVRAKGPLTGADDSHAVVEWAGRPGLAAVRKMIDDRAPFGILEMKSAWVTEDRSRGQGLTQVIARSGFHAMALTDINFCMATAGSYVLDRWRSSGGVVAEHIPATPYPDERYQTRLMWWDRTTFAHHAEPEQVARILQEMAMLRRDLLGLGEPA